MQNNIRGTRNPNIWKQNQFIPPEGYLKSKEAKDKLKFMSLKFITEVREHQLSLIIT